ncbi:MAG: HNH endonuclease [Odoribacter splanchnicus]
MKTDIIPYQKMTAEAILYKENDPLLRYAIYKAYKYRCAYTGKFLYDYSSMHLDHIIPQNTAPEVLQEKIRKYHLADDFTIDSLEIFYQPNLCIITVRKTGIRSVNLPNDFFGNMHNVKNGKSNENIKS